MREVVLDTETTGLDPNAGHRIVEIGCLELVNHVPTGKTYHQYINPEIAMPEEAFRIHGLSDDFLRSKPVFSDISKEFSSFISNTTLVIHNASFDLSFLKAEFERLDMEPLENNPIVDTVFLARNKFPGASARLDALCKRFHIDTSSRKLHGALLDAELLSSVYIELMGGRQQGLSLENRATSGQAEMAVSKNNWPNRNYELSQIEIENHESFVKILKNPMWTRQQK